MFNLEKIYLQDSELLHNIKRAMDVINAKTQVISPEARRFSTVVYFPLISSKDLHEEEGLQKLQTILDHQPFVEVKPGVAPESGPYYDAVTVASNYIHTYDGQPEIYTDCRHIVVNGFKDLDLNYAEYLKSWSESFNKQKG